jgi:serine protease Do
MNESDRLKSTSGTPCPNPIKWISKAPCRPIRAVLNRLLVLFALWAPALIYSVLTPSKAATTNPPPRLNIQEAPINRDGRAPVSFAPVAKKVAPSVVNIYSTLTIKERPNQLFNDPFFRHFFGDEFGPEAQPRERKAESLGSGVIVSPEGYILTASHVVEGAEAVKVALSSGEKEFDAKIIGTDPPTDLAVLKLNINKPLPALPIADSDKLEVGDIVLAVGNPFAVGQTLTMGIVSALGRGGFGINPGGYENFIQTDAAINPGNSGGALVDAEGRLVGINTAILSRSGGFQGVGFAVPINMARFVMERLIVSGKVTRGYLGVGIQPLTPELAKQFGLPDESSGVLIGEVPPEGAAAKAGVQEGDVVTEFAGKKVTDPRSLQLLVAQTPPGSRVTFRVWHTAPGRRPVEKVLSATLGELPQRALTGNKRNGSQPGGQQNMDALDGVEVSDLDGAARRQFDIPRAVRGALVVNVDPNSAAAEKGLRPGDVIVEIDRQAVRGADEAVALSEKAKGAENVLLRVWSRSEEGAGATRWMVVPNSKAAKSQ